MSIKSVLKAQTDAELLSYMMNEDPVLGELDRPVQGQSIAPIGKIIMDSDRYRNAFINMVNKIGLTVIDRNYWEDPWETFTERGNLNMGQTIEEIAVDISDVYDYNEYCNSATHFLETVIPNIKSYFHQINYQKFYKTTTSDDQMAMAFTEKDGMFKLIEDVIGANWEGYKYDKYIVNKYMLCRRILDGTVTSVEIDNYDSLTPRERVSAMKDVSNKMTFKSQKYNPAGLYRSTRFENQILILDTLVSAQISTEVLATSFFRNDAAFKLNSALIDGFDNHDTARLVKLLGSQYVPFTNDELSALANVAGIIIDREWFQVYNYAWNTDADPNAGPRATEFFNPETLKANHWLHTWKAVSTSPFKQAAVFTKNVTPAVSSVTVSPATATLPAGTSIDIKATVATTGFANKAVTYDIIADSETTVANKATVDVNGKVTIPSTHGHGSSGTQGTYYVTISTALATDEELTIEGVTYKAAAADDTAAKQATAIAALFASDPHYTVTVGTSTNANRLSFVEKSGWYGIGKPEVDDSGLTTGAVTESTGTAGVMASAVWVQATSVFDNTKYAISRITVS